MDRSVYLRRRLVAGGIVLAVIVAIFVLLVGGGRNSGEPASAVPVAKLAPQTTDLLTGLSDEEKVAQLIMAADPAPDDGPLGAVLVGSEDWPGAGGGATLTSELRKAHSDAIPTIVGTTQEGGDYRELPDLPPETGAADIGSTGKPKAVESWSAETAKALHDEGFDFNIGPLADIATLSGAVSSRAFSDDPAAVAAMVSAAYAGCAAEKLTCIPAHFPGEGAASEDTAASPANVSLDAQTLQGRDIPAFTGAFAQGAPAVVLSNAFFTAYDPVTPASISPTVLNDVLRKGLGFGGVAITGDLMEGAIRSGYKTAEAAVDAIEAGADMVQISDPDEIGPVRDALAAAVADGTISPERLNSATGRVLEMKGRMGIGTG